MDRSNDNYSNSSPVLPTFRISRVHRVLGAGDVSVHEAAAGAFSLWRDLRRQFPPHAFLRPAIGKLVLSCIPVQAVKVRDCWQIFGGFEAYAELQSLPSPKVKIQLEIQRFTKIAYEDIESLSLAFLLHNIGIYSLCGDVGDEQLRNRLKTTFSSRTRDLVLACDPTSRERYGDSIDANASALKRQAVRLRRSCSPDANFIADILEGLQHEETD